MCATTRRGLFIKDPAQSKSGGTRRLALRSEFVVKAVLDAIVQVRSKTGGAYAQRGDGTAQPLGWCAAAVHRSPLAFSIILTPASSHSSSGFPHAPSYALLIHN